MFLIIEYVILSNPGDESLDDMSALTSSLNEKGSAKTSGELFKGVWIIGS